MLKKLGVALIGTVVLAGCEIEQTESGDLPEVDVEPGEVPQYDVSWADVDVGTRTDTVTVPRLVVVEEEEEVEVPYIDVSGPDAGERSERTLTVETEVPHPGYSLNIRQVVVNEGTVYVVAELQETDPNAQQRRVRLSDRVVLNAPGADVEYLIVGERPAGGFNERFEYVPDMSALPPEVRNGRQLYSS